MSDPLTRLLNQEVVLDTAGFTVYLGKLVEVTDAVFVLEDADVHDCRDSRATKEVYTATAGCAGISVNRHRVIVMRDVVISVSALADVVTA